MMTAYGVYGHWGRVRGCPGVAMLSSLVLLVLQAACSPGGGEVYESRYRFVDPALRAASTLDEVRTGEWAVAEIRDETRFVLQTAPKALIKFQRGLLVPADGTLELLSTVPESLVDYDRVILVSQVYYDKAWHDLPVQLASSPASSSSAGFLKLRLKISPDLAGSRVRVNVVGYGIRENRNSFYETPAINVPANSVLRFGFGVLEPAWQQGKVSFEVEACEGETCSSIFSETVDPGVGAHQGWKNRQLDLAAHAEKKLSFRFTTSMFVRDETAFSLPVWANPTVYTKVSRRRDDVNVILLSIDTLRADHLGAYGYARDTSPFIDETFGDRGVVFDHPVAAATTTTPSHMSMFTSLYPSSHGLTFGLERLDHSLTTVSELLRAAGFETGAVTEDGWLGIEFGFGRGFNSYAENKSANVMAPEGQVDVTFAKTKQWLRRNYDRRFFLFLHTFQVHDPYAPPEAYQELFVGDGVVADEGSDDPMAHLRSPTLYDREIRYTDDELKSLFATLEELGLLRNTVFILTSDHGEEFGEHGHMGHGAHMHDEVQRVPLMFHGQGVPRGRRVGEPVSHLDLAPTILELSGVAADSQMRGLSLVDVLQGKRDRGITDRPLYGEGWTSLILDDKLKSHPFHKPAFSVRVGNRKLHRYRVGEGFVYELFDLVSDPGEKTDLLAQGVNANDLRELIDGFESAAHELRGELLRGGGDVQPDENFLDPAREEKLRALGYIE